MRTIPYTAEFVPKVVAFNSRIHKVFPKRTFHESATPDWLPKIAGREMFQEYYLALDDDGEMRGGYILKHQPFHIKGATVPICDVQMPISEGICDKKYGYVGVYVLMDALRQQPRLFGLGMGGMREPLPQMLKVSGWSIYPVPFFFKINSAFNFLRNITFLRKTAGRRLMLDFLAFSGLGWLGNTLAHLVQGKNSSGQVKHEHFDSFEQWADELWESAKNNYDLCAVRNAAILKILYPESEKRFIKIKVSSEGKLLGWAVMLDTQMATHKQFGAMRVGAIVDCFARTENAAAVMKAAASVLEKRGVDIIVSNQLNHDWGLALKQAGFLSGPTNFLFAASKQLAKLFEPVDRRHITLHINRGDGDGPINL